MTRVKVVSDGESGPSQPNTGESGVFGKGIDLNGHLLGTFNLKDGLGHVLGRPHQRPEWNHAPCKASQDPPFVAAAPVGLLKLGRNQRDKMVVSQRASTWTI